MRTALVTGASGFTGRYMVSALARAGFRVVGFGSECSEADETLDVDLTDAKGVHKAVRAAAPDWVIHLAAISFVGHGDAEAFYRVNVLGTENLLAALADLDAPPSRVLLASSANVYGRPRVEVQSEASCPAPVNHYACSKLSMEHMAANWFERLPIVIVRPFNYTGPGQDARFVIPKIVDHFARREPVIELGNIDVARDFGDVRDTIRSYLDIMTSEAAATVINVCTGRATTLREVLEVMEEIAGYAIEVQVNPAFVRSNDIARMCGDDRRLREITGRAPDTPLRRTLQGMYQSMLPMP